MSRVGRGSKVVKVVQVVKLGFNVIFTRVYKDAVMRWTGRLARTKQISSAAAPDAEQCPGGRNITSTSTLKLISFFMIVHAREKSYRRRLYPLSSSFLPPPPCPCPFGRYPSSLLDPGTSRRTVPSPLTGCSFSSLRPPILRFRSRSCALSRDSTGGRRLDEEVVESGSLAVGVGVGGRRGPKRSLYATSSDRRDWMTERWWVRSELGFISVCDGSKQIMS